MTANNRPTKVRDARVNSGCRERRDELMPQAVEVEDNKCKATGFLESRRPAPPPGSAPPGSRAGIGACRLAGALSRLTTSAGPRRTGAGRWSRSRWIARKGGLPLSTDDDEAVHIYGGYMEGPVGDPVTRPADGESSASGPARSGMAGAPLRCKARSREVHTTPETALHAPSPRRSSCHFDARRGQEMPGAVRRTCTYECTKIPATP
jgi:hypothetical protein